MAEIFDMDAKATAKTRDKADRKPEGIIKRKAWF